MSYLARLKAEFSGKPIPEELTKPTKAPSVSFVSAPSRHISKTEAANDDADALPDIAAQGRRQRVVAMLAERPGIKYAAITESLTDPENVILTLAIRGAMPDGGTVTCELRVPRDRYDPFLLLPLIERHGGTVH